MSEPKLNIKEETSAKKTRSPPKKAKVEQTVPKKKKLKTDAEKTAEKAQHLRFGKAELTPDELSRLSKAQKREMYADHAARSAVHHEVDQYEDENVGVQALSEGEKAAGNVRDISKSRYARKLKKKAKMQGKKGSKTAKSSASEPTAAQDAGASGTGEGGSNWLSRWKQRQEIHKSYYAAARSGTAAQTAGGKAASNGTTAAKSGMEEDAADAYTAEKEAAAQAEQDKLKAEEEAKKAAEEAAASGTEQPKENKVTKIASGFLGAVVLIALAAGGVFYAFAKQKQKKQAEKEALDPDANYTEDKGDFEIPTEDEPEETGEEDNTEE